MRKSTTELFNFAMLYLRKTDLIFGYLATLPMKELSAKRYAFGWCVIRYIDEIIDSAQSPDIKTAVLSSYEALIDQIQDGSKNAGDMSDNFELCLYEYLQMEKIATVETLTCFRNILKSFKMDIARTNKVLKWSEYDEYLFYRSDSVLELYYRLFFNKISPVISDLAKDYARSFQYVDDVCDFYKDMDVGQINITSDEIKLLSISSITLNDSNDSNNFSENRKNIVLGHYFNFIENVDTHIKSLIIRRYLKESIGYNISPIIDGCFKPGTDIKLPFKSIILLITSPKRQDRLFKVLNILIYVYCLIPWYSYSRKQWKK